MAKEVVPARNEPIPQDCAALCAEMLALDETPAEGPVVPRDRVLEFAIRLKETLGFNFMVYCAATHYPEQGEPGAEDHLPDRTLVAYRVRRMPRKDRPTATFPFRVWVPTGESTPSLANVWAGADWQEREQLDLVGTVFADHPDPRRIMMDEDWPGHPLRRDYSIDTSHFPWR